MYQPYVVIENERGIHRTLFMEAVFDTELEARVEAEWLYRTCEAESAGVRSTNNERIEKPCYYGSRGPAAWHS